MTVASSQPKCERCGKPLRLDYVQTGEIKRLQLIPCPCINDLFVTCPTCGGSGRVEKPAAAPASPADASGGQGG